MTTAAMVGARLHHVGYLVVDIGESARRFCDALGYVVESDIIPDVLQTAAVQFLRLPGDAAWLELISPLQTPSKLDSALRRGEGMHHFCYEVPSIEANIVALRDRGMVPVARILPGAAFGGRRIAWMMGRAGLLVELLETGPGPLSLGHRDERPSGHSNG